MAALPFGDFLPVSADPCKDVMSAEQMLKEQYWDGGCSGNKGCAMVINWRDLPTIDCTVRHFSTRFFELLKTHSL